MIKLDLLKDSLNYQSQSHASGLTGKPSEDFSDLDFSTPEKLDLDDVPVDENIPSFEEDILADESENDDDSLLADLGLEEEQEKISSTESEEINVAETEPDIMDEEVSFSRPEQENESLEQTIDYEVDMTDSTPGFQIPEPEKQEPSSGGFDFSASGQEYSEFDEEQYDTGGKSKALPVIIVLVLIAIAVGSYFIFFKGEGGLETEAAESPQQSEAQNLADIEKQKKINDLSNLWKSFELSNSLVFGAIQDISSLRPQGAQLSMIRFRDNRLVLTADGESREDFANLNVELKNKLSVKNMEYINDISFRNVNDSKKLFADISLELSPTPSSGQPLDVISHQNETADDVQTFLKQSGLSVSKFTEKPGSPRGNYAGQSYCKISGKGNYGNYIMAVGQISAKFPQLSLSYMTVYSDNLKPLKQSQITFIMEFEFYRANL